MQHHSFENSRSRKLNKSSKEWKKRQFCSNYNDSIVTERSNTRYLFFSFLFFLCIIGKLVSSRRKSFNTCIAFYIVTEVNVNIAALVLEEISNLKMKMLALV